MSKPIVLITGATGKQGSAVLNQLLAQPEGSNWAIRIITRNSTSSKSAELAAKGIDVRKGDLGDRASLDKALEGVQTAFLVTTPYGTSPEVETEQGNSFVDAAKAAGVEHLIFTSVDGAERSSGVPHFQSKFEIEKHLRAAGFPSATVLRPVAFMDNFSRAAGMERFIGLGIFAAALQRGKRVQWVATQDIGWFAARAIVDRETWTGKEIALAGDDLSVDEMKDVYGRVQGGRPWVAWLPVFTIRFLPTDMQLMFKFFNQAGYTADIPALRKIHPGLLNFEDWLRNPPAA